MFLEKVYSEGLGHISYILGDQGIAAVIDPRRDCGTYAEIARERGVRIRHIFETHRNEDYVTGSLELQKLTGAEIHHSGRLPFKYGNTISEGDTIDLGRARIGIIETPGHSYESISLILSDLAFDVDPVAVFTGDALFVGDTGRTDFIPDRREASRLLYESIFEKLLVLGDHVNLYPAHGAGSICGSAIARRDFSTLGYERLHNPALQKTVREDFITMKLNEHHYKPLYFRKMEEYNLSGPTLLGSLPIPRMLGANELEHEISKGMIIVDIRSPEAFAGAHIPGCVSLPLPMVSTFAGWLLPYDAPIGIVADDLRDVERAVRLFIRVGYDRIDAVLSGGMNAWETAGKAFGKCDVVNIREIGAGDGSTLLDVRSEKEFEAGHLPGALNVYVGELLSNLDLIPGDKPINTICSSGMRATIAASLLKRSEYSRVGVCLGSMQACAALKCSAV